MANYDKQNGYQYTPTLVFDEAQKWMLGPGDDSSIGILFKHALVATFGVDVVNGVAINARIRTTTANVNAGATLLPAVPGLKYRISDCKMISIGGSAATCTSVNVAGTQAAGAVQLFVFGQAQLTQSTILYPGITGCTILADGASFVANDANTAITINSVTNNLATSTNIDVILTFVLGA